ncbi:quinoprotein dehydrogenase-associated putative ABC transporter substrate-binding protein [Methylomonas sp. AM2-LC]|uniref:quinoprotein dehydrogenase-associated putative ABC transporter substrate-binding protein n=1 Tax=Methylomonas sp. AM2-LC TaxID=3153301 RepID=UPI0032646879
MLNTKMKHSKSLIMVSLLALVLSKNTQAEGVLKVCAEPNNLPFSNDKGEGFENKIAELLAKDLNRSVVYTWQRQGEGFIRQTLGSGACDVVIGVPAQLEGVKTTTPYYCSIYAIVTRKKSHLNIHSYADPAWKKLKIGLHSVGSDGSNSPPAHALGLHDLGSQVVGYTMWGTDDESPQGDVVKAVADGSIDIAIVWGPFAGYFAKPFGSQLIVRPAPVEPALPNQPFAWDIAAAVRSDDEALLVSLDDSLRRQSAKIQGILKNFGVPIIKLDPVTVKPQALQSTQ